LRSAFFPHKVALSMTAEAPKSAVPAAVPDVARSAGRGGLAVAFAKIYFIVTGLVQQVALPRFIGLDGYGAFGTALSVVSVWYNPITSTSIQGVSRAVAQAPGAEPAALRRTLRLHVALATVIAVLLFALAPTATRVMGAPHLTGAIRILCGVVFIYGFYTPLVGALNGGRRFVHQAGLDILAATLRTLGIILGAYVLAKAQASAFAGVEGAAWGFVGAALSVFVAALAVVGVGRAGPGGPTVRAHFWFIAPLFLGQYVLNLLMQADSILLRVFASEVAVRQGLSPQAVDVYAGAYRAAQLFAFLPYQLLIAVTFVLFPMLASAGKSGSRDEVRRYVATGLRLALVIAGAIVSVTSGLAAPLIRLVYGAQASDLGARALSLLAVGIGVFAIFGILTSILNSLGQELASLIVTAAAAGLVAVTCFFWVRGTPLSDELLFRTATATSASIALATVVTSVLVHGAAGGLVPLRVVARVAFAGTLAALLGRALSSAPFFLGQGVIARAVGTSLYALAVVAAYGVVLLVTRELGRDDLALVKRVLKRSS
jgi:stage V sporulation protein B